MYSFKRNIILCQLSIPFIARKQPHDHTSCKQWHLVSVESLPMVSSPRLSRAVTPTLAHDSIGIIETGVRFRKRNFCSENQQNTLSKGSFCQTTLWTLNKPSKSSFFSPNWLSMASLAQTGVTILDMTISKAFGTVPERILTNVNVNKPTNAVLTEIITEKATFKPFFRANFNDNLQSNSLNKFCNRKIDT